MIWRRLCIWNDETLTITVEGNNSRSLTDEINKLITTPNLLAVSRHDLLKILEENEKYLKQIDELKSQHSVLIEKLNMHECITLTEEQRKNLLLIVKRQ
jgi:hypothetical protein